MTLGLCGKIPVFRKRTEYLQETLLASMLACNLANIIASNFLNFFFFFCRWTFVDLRGHWFFPSPPQRPMTSDFEGFSIPDFIHYIYFPILILEKDPEFSVLSVQY